MNETAPFIFGNRYRVIKSLGAGGMAEVFQALDTTLDREVAIKVLLPKFANSDAFATQFKDEARSAARLTDPHIVRIFDWGQDGDRCYIVMEYVHGIDLKKAIREQRMFDSRTVASIALQVCQALDEAHAYEIIHRDIKSANIMLQSSGNIKLMDFGIAQRGIDGANNGIIAGTANYMSPEQIMGKPAIAASDLYSLGIVMYEACTMRTPFMAPDSQHIFQLQLYANPIPPNRLSPYVDRDLNRIIMRALQKEPEKRYPSAASMKSALQAYIATPTHYAEPIAYPSAWAIAIVRGPDEYIGETASFNRPTLVGRSKSADIIIPDKTVSGKHLMLAPRGTYLEVEDLGTLNGTYVNGQAVQKKQRVLCQPGATIDIGRVRLKIGCL